MRADSPNNQFVILYLGSQTSIRQLLQLLIRNHRLLDDACQAVALRLWELFDTYDQSRPFDSWARGVAAKVALEFQRTERRKKLLPIAESVTALLAGFDRCSLSSTESSQQMEALEACLDTLPDRTRKLLVMRYHQSLPIEEVAVQMNKTLEATYKALQRTIQALGECVRRRVTETPRPVKVG